MTKNKFLKVTKAPVALRMKTKCSRIKDAVSIGIFNVLLKLGIVKHYELSEQVVEEVSYAFLGTARSPILSLQIHARLERVKLREAEWFYTKDEDHPVYVIDEVTEHILYYRWRAFPYQVQIKLNGVWYTNDKDMPILKIIGHEFTAPVSPSQLSDAEPVKVTTTIVNLSTVDSLRFDYGFTNLENNNITLEQLSQYIIGAFEDKIKSMNIGDFIGVNGL